MNIVIIGSGTGGLFTAVTIKKQNRDAQITFVDKKDFDLLHPCGLPYVLEGKVDSFEKLKSDLPDMGFVKMHQHEAISVNPSDKKVEIRNLESETSQLDYDKLVIASGASAVVLPVSGVDLKGVFTLDNWENSFALSEMAKTAKKATVVGAGAIGLETANALKERGLEVTIVEMLPCALAKAIDPDMSKILEEYLKTKGINLMFDSKVEEIKGNNNVESVVVNGNIMETDIVVMAAGVKPNTDFLKDSGITMGKWGITVNEQMQTNFPDIYAVGDCVQTKSLIDCRDWMMQLAVAAYKQGIVAGNHILGNDAAYKGALTTFSSKIGDMEVAATGFNSHCVDAIAGKAKALTRPEWCSGGKDLTIKLLVDKTGKLLGGQAVGEEGAAHRIDVVSTAIKAGFSIYDFSEIELTYCPAISETYDVLMQAADNAIRKLR